jgi:hypothetical protein
VTTPHPTERIERVKEKEAGMHVDDFIDDYEGDPYARWFFMLQRLPAALKVAFYQWIKPYRLFCDYKGKRYRVTGASRLGDIWLAKDHSRETGYDLRVDLTECTNWSDKP